MTTKIVTYREEYFKSFDLNNELEYISIEDLCFELGFEPELGIDLETNGWSAYIEGSKVWSMGISTPNKVYLIDLETIPITNLTPILTTKTLIIQNAVFDLPWLYREDIVPKEVWDTYTSEYVLSLGIPSKFYHRGLEDLVERYLYIKLDKSAVKKISNKGIDSMESVHYAANDVRYLHKIKESQIDILNKRDLLKVAILESAFTRVLAYIEHCGIHLNWDEWYVRTRNAEHDEWSSYLLLMNLLNTKFLEVKGSLTSIPDGTEFNWNSSKQVLELFKLLGINTIDSKTKKETVEASVISKGDHELIAPYLAYKEKAKLVSTYGRNFYDYIQSDGRIHTKFTPIVDTGRTSSGNTKKGPFPNLQNLDASSETRACFQGQGNNVLIVSDYSSQEGVVLADRSQEPALLEFYRSGEADMHSYVARHIFPDLKGLTSKEIKDKYPDKRTAAKAAGFAISYGGNGATIADNMGISVEDGDKILRAYMSAFPKLEEYFKKVSDETLHNGYILINPISGRKRYIYGFKDFYRDYFNEKFWDDYKLYKKVNQVPAELQARVKNLMITKSQIYRLSLNSPIQGTSADISKRAGCYIFDWIISNGYFNKVKIVNFVHDEYVLESSEKLSNLVSDKVKYYMEKAGSDYLTTLKLVADPVITKRWKK